MKDLKNNVYVYVGLDGQTISSDTTTAGNIIDCLGAESVLVVPLTGAVSLGDVTVLLKDGDDSGLSDGAEVPDTFLIGLESDTTLDTAHTTSTVGYKVRKRYLEPSAVTANSANLYISMLVILGYPHSSPMGQ